ncbi:MAG: alkaline phosphatase family protein [Bacteroidetes bacterium]|nr:alkaline phosphatase family protein [Bacteroidota bacterium]
MGKRLAKKLLLVGWDAADWKIINPLMDAGKMPALESLVNEGVMGNLATLDPPLSPMLWTSIATGKTADKHGVLGFTEPDPKSGGIRPVMSTSRKVKAMWNVMTQHGMKTHVVGWWPSHPAEPINGISISNFYQRANAPINKPWPMMEGTVHPKDKEELFKTLRIHPDELTEAHILPFVPKAGKIDQDKDLRIGALSKILADCSTIHSAGTWIIENEEWDLMAIYYDAIDHFCHAFMKFHPPQLRGVPDDLFEYYKDVVTGGYLFHDMMLARLIQLAGPDTTIMLISDHGFHSDHLRPLALPKEPAAPALEHSPYGIICMKGPGIKKDERIYGASVLDITPTVYTLFGLPVAEDMDGHALVSAFNKEILPESIPSWDDIPGEDGRHKQENGTGSTNTEEVLDQLVDLGYIDKPDKDKKKALKVTVDESQYNLARVYINTQRYKEAVPILEKLFDENKKEQRFGLRLATCYQNLNRLADCRATISKIRRKTKKRAPALDLMEGSLLLGENKPLKALEYFKKAEKYAPALPNLYLQLGRGFSQLKKWADAERAYKKALIIDGDNSQAHHGLAVTYLRRNKYEEAIDGLLTAVGLIYHFPFAHYHLGETLFKMGEFERAAEAFEVCLTMSPNINKARHWLLEIYSEMLKQPEKVKIHEDYLEALDIGTVYVVSGLPRSGTSMMMQMLETGGLEIFQDGKRKADSNNPRGYYEHEKVKGLMRDRSWVKDAEDKVVKVISQLLMQLPPKFKYKVIFMERDIYEVVSSQVRMIEKIKKKKTKTYPLGLEMAYRKNVEKIKEWSIKQPNMEILYVKYTDVLDKPLQQSRRINEFLGGELNAHAMSKVVDKKLYRSKNKSA